MTGHSVPVLIVSRSPAFAVGMSTFLSVAPFAPLIAHSVDEALDHAGANVLALAIIDAQVADAPGLELAGELTARSPGTRVLLALHDDTDIQRVRSLSNGAYGYVLHTWTAAAVIETVTETVASVRRLDVTTARSLADLARRSGPRQVLLTEQERVVLRLMRQRLTYKEIALRLGVSWHTVRTHAQSILRKMGIHSRHDLDAWDARLGIAAEPTRATNGTAPALAGG